MSLTSSPVAEKSPSPPMTPGLYGQHHVVCPLCASTVLSPGFALAAPSAHQVLSCKPPSPLFPYTILSTQCPHFNREVGPTPDAFLAQLCAPW